MIHACLLSLMLAGAAPQEPEPKADVLVRAARIVLGSPRLYRAAGAVARAALRLLPRPFLYHRFNPWGISRELPAPPASSFRAQWNARDRRGYGS